MLLKLIAILALPLSLQASTTYDLDLAHTTVEFKVKHLVISRVTGRFNKFSGTFVGDEKSKKLEKVEAEIDVASIDTNEKKRDDHLRGGDFFEAEKFPKITFKSTGVESKDGKKGKIKGELTIKGITKPVTLDAEYTGTVKDPWGKENAGFRATTKINRKDFGITWNKSLDGGGMVVGEEVEISIEGAGIPKK